MMSLTATATKKSQMEICCVLGMNNPIVELSPNKPNVYLACSEFTSIVETFGPLAEQLKTEQTNMGRAIIFCKKILLCSHIYSFFQFMLKTEFTEPPNKSPSITKYLLVDMFTSGTHPDVKEIILDSFKSYTAPLRVVITNMYNCIWTWSRLCCICLDNSSLQSFAFLSWSISSLSSVSTVAVCDTQIFNLLNLSKTCMWES